MANERVTLDEVMRELAGTNRTLVTENSLRRVAEYLRAAAAIFEKAADRVNKQGVPNVESIGDAAGTTLSIACHAAKLLELTDNQLRERARKYARLFI